MAENKMPVWASYARSSFSSVMPCVHSSHTSSSLSLTSSHPQTAQVPVSIIENGVKNYGFIVPLKSNSCNVFQNLIYFRASTLLFHALVAQG